jgi:arylsulfatase A-like enzyme
VVLLAALLCSGCSKPAQEPPNVVLYIVDTLRADGLASYGNARASTPHFDALAREGVLFENAFASASWTRASVATILTGLHPWRHGAEGRDDRLSESVATLGQLFGAHGYATALVTANPNVGSAFGFERAFDQTIELYLRREPGAVRGKELITPSDVLTREALRWLDTVEGPFLLVVLAIDPHAPYTPPARFASASEEGDRSQVTGRFASINRPDLSEADRERIRELYLAEVAFNDESFGALRAALGERGLDGNTVVALTSDHGEEFWEHGRRGHGKSLVDELLRVPLVIAAPHDPRVEAGSRVADRVALADLMPTLLDLGGMPIPGSLDGRSLLGASPTPDRPVLAGLRMDDRDLLAARRGDFKLVWDRSSGERRLYALDGDRPEAVLVDPSHHPNAEQAEQELLDLLESAVAERGPGQRTPTSEIPDDVRESLRALGYAE